jgi:hypothetical protein
MAEAAADAAPAPTYVQDGPEAREIARVIPYFPFKNIPRFYDIGGFLSKPEVFQRIVDIFAARYSGIGIDSVAGLDARGFVLGPPIALALGKPFIMIRKKGKMPNCIESPPYEVCPLQQHPEHSGWHEAWVCTAYYKGNPLAQTRLVRGATSCR